jgi:ataxin-3
MHQNGASLIYWEPQAAGLCGVHCVNSLLQSPVVSAVDLADIAQRLDALEKGEA